MILGGTSFAQLSFSTYPSPPTTATPEEPIPPPDNTVTVTMAIAGGDSLSMSAIRDPVASMDIDGGDILTMETTCGWAKESARDCDSYTKESSRKS